MSPKQALNFQRATLLRNLACCVGQLNRIQEAVDKLDTCERNETYSPRYKLCYFQDMKFRLQSIDDSLRGQWGWKPRETFESLMAVWEKQEAELMAKQHKKDMEDTI